MNFNQVTIKDIARELGISPSTVSRALKDHPDININTKKAVNELAEKMNYQPNIVALSLRKSKTNTIGIIIPEIVHHFFSTVINGIESVAREAGYNVLLSQSQESASRESASMMAMFNSRVDGLLVSLARETTDFKNIESIIQRGMPVVFFDRKFNHPSVSSVVVDDYEGAKQAVRHLISIGCKKIMHIMDNSRLQIAQDRYRGYTDALTEAGMKVDKTLVFESPTGTMEESYSIMKKVLSAKKFPDGLFAGSDPKAMGAIQAIKEKKIKIPEQLAVVGFGNWFYDELMEPTLTSVDQHGYEMGQEAARMLIHLIDFKIKSKAFPIPETKILKTRLMIRQSSKRD